MSLIDPHRVTAVLLTDGWHNVDQLSNGYSSFSIAHFAFSSRNVSDQVVFPPPGSSNVSGSNTAGCLFEVGGSVIRVPQASVLAVRLSKDECDE